MVWRVCAFREFRTDSMSLITAVTCQKWLTVSKVFFFVCFFLKLVRARIGLVFLRCFFRVVKCQNWLSDPDGFSSSCYVHIKTGSMVVCAYALWCQNWLEF